MTDKVLENLVRVGTVTAINLDERTARVKFQDTGITSGYLKVLSNQPYIPDYVGSHKHNLIIKPWMPHVNDTVLVLYLPVFNADGFVLGGLG